MKKLLSLLVIFILAGTTIALAQPTAEELAAPWQLGFSPPATPLMEKLDNLHDLLMVIITLITLFVLALLLFICVRYNRRANPIPSKTTHNTRLEVIWTVIPILILVVIAIPSLRIHYYIQRVTEPEMTVKVVGYQWYWHYEYPDHGGFGYDSYMKKKEDLQEGEHRLLAVDNQMVVPVDTKVRVLVTGADVIHAFALPVFGIKRDAVPGRLNDTWFEAKKTGRFYGQCSELCGVGHGFMPIVIDVVSREEFDTWVASKQKEAGVTSAAQPAEGKDPTPVTPAVPSTIKDPAPVIEKEKKLSKPTASDSKKPGDDKPIGKDNQPVPSKAAESAPSDTKKEEE